MKSADEAALKMGSAMSAPTFTPSSYHVYTIVSRSGDSA
jgi:hypothetical protein